MKKILILTEENPAMLRRRLIEQGLNKEEILILPRFKVSDWAEAVSQIELAVKTENVSFVVVDTLPAFWCIQDENTAPDVMKAIQILQKVVLDHNLAVLLLHHLRKMPGKEGTAHRGSTALTSAVDIGLELHRVPNCDNRREIESISRFDETPPGIVFERVNGELVSLGDASQANFDDTIKAVLAVLPPSSPGKIKKEIEDALSEPKPSDSLLKAVLRSCHKRNLIIREGTGHRGNPYRYFVRNNNSNQASLYPLGARIEKKAPPQAEISISEGTLPPDELESLLSIPPVVGSEDLDNGNHSPDQPKNQMIHEDISFDTPKQAPLPSEGKITRNTEDDRVTEEEMDAIVDEVLKDERQDDVSKSIRTSVNP